MLVDAEEECDEMHLIISLNEPFLQFKEVIKI